ncbi:stalk domain-containing protein [Candidatus Syntrophocurvum alkaliphilum]|nr:stalk domain-containing protein [Candidatus Syntrophocurvum alkaliphilum]
MLLRRLSIITLLIFTFTLTGVAAIAAEESQDSLRGLPPGIGKQLDLSNIDALDEEIRKALPPGILKQLDFSGDLEAQLENLPYGILKKLDGIEFEEEEKDDKEEKEDKKPEEELIEGVKCYIEDDTVVIDMGTRNTAGYGIEIVDMYLDEENILVIEYELEIPGDDDFVAQVITNPRLEKEIPEDLQEYEDYLFVLLNYEEVVTEPIIDFEVDEVTVDEGIVSLTVTVTNTGTDYENARYAMMVKVDDLEEDSITVSYGDDLSFTLNRVLDLDYYLGYFGPSSGFTIENGWDATTTFEVDFSDLEDTIVTIDAWVGEAPEPARYEALVRMEQQVVAINVDEDKDENGDKDEEETKDEEKDRGKKRGLERALENVRGNPAESVIKALIEGRSPSEVAKNLRDKANEDEDLDKELIEEVANGIIEELDELDDEVELNKDEVAQAYKDLASVFEKFGNERVLNMYELMFAKMQGSDEYKELLIDAHLRYQNTELKTFVNGLQPVYDVKPRVANNRTIVPARALTESLGAEVDWCPDTQIVKITRDDLIIELPIDSETAFVNGEEKELDCAAVIEDGRTLVPLRFISETLQAEVDYDHDSRLIFVQ